MTATADAPAPISAREVPNARTEPVFLTAETYTLTARQLVYALAAHLARYGDTLTVKVVDPLCAVDSVMRFDGADLMGWITGRTPIQVATVLARAETIARDYFGTGFPVIRW